MLCFLNLSLKYHHLPLLNVGVPPFSHFDLQFKSNFTKHLIKTMLCFPLARCVSKRTICQSVPLTYSLFLVNLTISAI